ncbi:hypothetical protein Tco_1274118 [Tanacetum coccineum]
MLQSPPVRRALSSRLRLQHLKKVRVHRRDAEISLGFVLMKRCRFYGVYSQHDMVLPKCIDKGKGKDVDGPSVNMTKEGKIRTTNKTNERNMISKNTGVISGNKKNVNASGSGKGSKDHSQDQGQNLVPVWNRFVKFPISLICEAFYVQVDAIAWWIDSGSTTHVCKDRCWFETYEPVEDESVLYMGDDHFAPVHGKGSVVLEFRL